MNFAEESTIVCAIYLSCTYTVQGARSELDADSTKISYQQILLTFLLRYLFVFRVHLGFISVAEDK